MKPVNKNCIGKEILARHEILDEPVKEIWKKYVLVGIESYICEKFITYYALSYEPIDNYHKLIGKRSISFVNVNNKYFKRCPDVIYGDENE